MRGVHRLLLVLGAASLAALIGWVGGDRLLGDAVALGWGVTFIVWIALVEHALHTAGWRACFAPGREPTAGTLLGLYLAGQAVNHLTPTASVGGELARANLLPGPMGAGERMASLAADRLAWALADVLIGAAGLVALLQYAPASDVPPAALAAAAALVVLGVALFLQLQRRGRIGGLLRAPSRGRFADRAWAGRLAEAGGQLDASLAELHGQHGGRFLASIGLHTAGTLVGAAQLAVFLWWLDVPFGPGSLAIAFAVAIALDLFSFFVPGRLGAFEAARVLGFQVAGFDPALGLLFGLSLRLEQLCWDGVGLVVYAQRAERRRVASEEAA